MSVDFRCARCGLVVSVDAAPAEKTRCPHCGARVEVPALLASLPRPLVARDAGPPAAQLAAASAEGATVDAGDASVMGTMSRLMPYVISVFFHTGVLVILAFLTLVVLGKPPAPAVATPNLGLTDKPPGPLSDKRPDVDTDKQRESLKKLAQRFQRSNRDMLVAPDPVPAAMKNPRMAGLGPIVGDDNVWRPGRRGPGFFDIGLDDEIGGDDDSDKRGTRGGGGGPCAIVYVVDRSGSMLDTFDDVRKELARSLSTLGEGHLFHVIFFAGGKPMENPPHRMVPGVDGYRLEAWRYVAKVQPAGQTDVVPALKRAFDVLAAVADEKQVPGTDEKGRTVMKTVRVGKVIYLLTDGEFSDNVAVLKEIRKLNAAGRVRIHTILHHHRSTGAMTVLRQIADEHGGKFKFVEPE